jgi:long-chain acyl-CoA synthetase
VIQEDSSLAELIRRQGRELGDRPFLLWQGEAISYREYDARTERLAAGLAALGIGKGDHVAVVFPNGPRILEVYGALLKRGAIPVPGNPAYRPAEWEYLLTNSEARLLLVDGRLAERVLPTARALPGLTVAVDGEAPEGTIPLERLLREGERAPEVPLGPDDVAFILYTSGTTGRPKGAMLTHRGQLLSIRLIHEAIQSRAEDRALAHLPAFHLFHILVEYLHMLAVGGSVVLREGFHPRGVLQDIERYGATFLSGVPSMFLLMADLAERERFDLGTLRLGIVAAAPVPPELPPRYERLSGSVLLQAYGMTEYGVATIERVDGPRKPGSAGQPAPGVELRLVDEAGREVPVGEVGEIAVRHPGIMKGYWRMPEETAASFREGWFLTGDLARRDEDGFVYIVGRKKDMIIYGGFNIYPKEIEDVILQHPGVAEAAVIGLPDPLKGQFPRAVITVKEGARVEPEEILALCRERLAPFKVPRDVVVIDAFPKTATGKIRKVELVERFIGQQVRR